MSYNVRVLFPSQAGDLAMEIRRLGGVPPPAEALARLGFPGLVRLERVPAALARRVKEAMEIAAGGAALHPADGGGGADGPTEVLLGGSVSQMEAACARLRALGPDAADLAAEVEALLSVLGHPPTVFRCRSAVLDLSRPQVVGILNVTPDSFADGGRYLDPGLARERAHAMVAEGADLIDIGGESTRPGADPIPPEEEVRRVLPVVKTLRSEVRVPLSVDTRKAGVARQVLDAGADMINDISGLQGGPGLAREVAVAGGALVLMHMKGTPRTMQAEAHYRDLVGEVMAFLRTQVALAEEAGVDPSAIAIDPGIGFAKRAEHSLTILRRLGEFRSLGRPLYVGPSRKSFIGAVLDLPTEDRLEGTAAAVAAAILGGASFVRVHDVGPMVRVARVAHAIGRA